MFLDSDCTVNGQQSDAITARAILVKFDGLDKHYFKLLLKDRRVNGGEVEEFRPFEKWFSQGKRSFLRKD